MMHPVNRFERKNFKSDKTNEEKRKETKERSSRVWWKRSKEAIKERETTDELEEYFSGT